MKKSIIRYSLYGSLTLSVLFVLGMAIGGSIDYSTSEVFGYASMVISLLFVFFGIKHFRDHINDGKVTLGKAIVIGLLISLFSAIGFAIVDYIYTTSINPNFAVEYKEYTMTQLNEANLSAEDFKTKVDELEASMDMMGSSSFMAFVMFGTVMIIGFIISLISGLVLQRK